MSRARYHFSGVGGAGMSPLARLMRARGHAVQGSDRAFDTGRNREAADALRAAGVELVPHDGSGITAAVDRFERTGYTAVVIAEGSDAVAVARANAKRNGVEARFLDGLSPLTFTADVVVANILANPLKVLAPLLASRIRHGGRLALSGILPDQASEIEKSYAPWIKFAPRTESEGWACLSGVRL